MNVEMFIEDKVLTDAVKDMVLATIRSRKSTGQGTRDQSRSRAAASVAADGALDPTPDDMAGTPRSDTNSDFVVELAHGDGGWI